MQKVCLSIIVSLIVLGLLELGSRLFESKLTSIGEDDGDGPGWQADFFASLFDWHQPDPDLLWRLKPNLDQRLIKTGSRHFIGEEVEYNKPKGVKRVFILGDSSPVGLGLPSYRLSFANLTATRLNMDSASGMRVELINASTPGHSSEQLVRLMEWEGWKYDPDAVILFCGNNDASISGCKSDRELMAGQRLVGVRRLAAKLALYRVIRSLLCRAVATEEPEEALVVRVGPDRFAENLQRLADQCHRRDVPLLVVCPPAPRLWPAGLQFKPISRLRTADGGVIMPPGLKAVLDRPMKYCLDQSIFRSLYGEGDLFTREVYQSAFNDSLQAEGAVELYSARVRSDPQDFISLNNLGVSYWQAGDYDVADNLLREAREVFAQGLGDAPSEADRSAGSVFLYNIGINLRSMADDYKAGVYLDSALQEDYFSLRIKRPYVEAISQISEQPGVTLIDLPRLFAENGGEGLFIDHCHPTARGHSLIADCLVEVLKGVL
ncbi:MAG: hypothetical protein JSU65_14190 [Candidatus Zixiibacteriota bacterium]|nr:MAG: hypothetical protein JSU65_14190 [candidate division Zixibacteria bacterium]